MTHKVEMCMLSPNGHKHIQTSRSSVYFGANLSQAVLLGGSYHPQYIYMHGS